MVAEILCAAALTLWPHSVRVDREAARVTCVELAYEAEARGMDPTMALAVASVETKFSAGAVSPAGAVGVLQIVPKWSRQDMAVAGCAGLKGCDLTAVGVVKLKRVIRKYGVEEGLARYAGCRGKCTRAKNYARRVLKKTRRLRRTAPLPIERIGIFGA